MYRGPDMKLLYKPFGIIFGILAGLLSRKVFEQVWSAIDDEQPPHATTKEAPTAKVIGAAALQGAVFASVTAAVNRWGANGFYKLTGLWPGDRLQEPADE